MRVLSITILCLTLCSFLGTDTKKKPKKIPVSGTVTLTGQYCGGARPSDEILAQAAKPRPLSNKKIYIKKGEVNAFDSKVLLTLTTDSKGNFQTKLPPGKYLVVDSTQKDLTHYNMLSKTYKDQTESYEAIDTVCLKEWYLKPACVFEVTGKETKDISVNFHKPCRNVPCAQFRGALPQ